MKMVTYLTKEHLILRRSQKRTTTTAEYRALPVHERSTQRCWTEVTSARPRRGSSSGELWRRHPRRNAHICGCRRLKSERRRVKVLLYLPAWYLNIYTRWIRNQWTAVLLPIPLPFEVWAIQFSPRCICSRR